MFEALIIFIAVKLSGIMMVSTLSELAVLKNVGNLSYYPSSILVLNIIT